MIQVELPGGWWGGGLEQILLFTRSIGAVLILPETRPNDVVSAIYLNVIHFSCMARKCFRVAIVCPLNDINRGGVGSQGKYRKPLSSPSVAEFSSSSENIWSVL